MDFLEYPFIPSIECDAISDPILPAHPVILKKTASPVPIISGLCDMEGLVIFGGKSGVSFSWVPIINKVCGLFYFIFFLFPSSKDTHPSYDKFFFYYTTITKLRM